MLTLATIQVPTETPPFNERKATEAGVRLLQAAGGRLSIAKLLTMLFIVDRRVIQEAGSALTDDEYIGIEGEIAVPFGLAQDAAKLTLFDSTWHRHIEGRLDQTVRVLHQIEPLVLSYLEVDIVEAVGREYSTLDDVAFIDKVVAEAPEVAHLGGVRFGLRSILISLGVDPRDAEEAHQDWASFRRIRYDQCQETL